MEVDEDAVAEAGQHVQHDMVDVAAHLDSVRGVDDEEVVRSELAEALWRELLGGDAGELGQAW